MVAGTLVALGIVVLARTGNVSFGQGLFYAGGGYGVALIAHNWGLTDAVAQVMIGAHFWRLLGLMIGIFAPFFLLFVGVEMALAGQVPPASGASQEVQIIAGMVRAREILPVMSGLSFLMSPLMIGLFASASVSAWRRIKGEPVTNILA